MKQLKYFLWVAVVAISIVGCHKPVEVSFENATQEIEAQGGSIEIGLKSNGAWTIESTAEWLTVSPMSGSGDATLTLTAQANATGESRMANVRAFSKDNSSVLTVTQGFTEPEQYVNVTPKELLCDSEGDEFVVALSTNVDWFVSAPDWITCSPTEGSGDARITITVNPVESDVQESREAEVVIGNQSVFDKVHVVQTVEPVLDIELTPNSLQFVCTGETKTMNVSTEDSWSTSTESDWVTLSQTEGQGDAEISVTVGENPIYFNRVAIVIFTTAGNVQKVLTIHQEASPNPHFLEVSPREIAFGKEGGENEITIGCDTDWEFDLDCEWLTLSQLSGSGNATVVLTADPNMLTETRSVEFYAKSGSLSSRLTVTQAAGDIPIEASFEPDTLFVPYTGGLQHVQLTSNTSWTLQYDSWISIYAATSGEGDASFDIIIDSNSGSNSRTGYVNAIHNGEVISALVIVQEGKTNDLETDITELDVRPEGGEFEIQVTANQAWTVHTDVDWLHCNPSSGFGNGSFTITVDVLSSPRPREGHIKVVGDAGSEVVIIVNQH
jgi:hypothetical protein